MGKVLKDTQMGLSHVRPPPLRMHTHTRMDTLMHARAYIPTYASTRTHTTHTFAKRLCRQQVIKDSILSYFGNRWVLRWRLNVGREGKYLRE